MTYTNARKDANSVATMCGISDLDGSVMPLQFDPVTGRLLIEVYVVTDEGGQTVNRARKDSNSVSTIIGVSDTTGVLIPIIDHRNGYLFCDVIDE